MAVYGKDAVLLVGHAKLANGYVTGNSFDEQFFMPFILEGEDYRIVDVSANVFLDITKEFLKNLLVGYSLLNDFDRIENQVRRCYFGTSRKAILAALRDAGGRLREVVEARQAYPLR